MLGSFLLSFLSSAGVANLKPPLCLVFVIMMMGTPGPPTPTLPCSPTQSHPCQCICPRSCDAYFNSRLQTLLSTFHTFPKKGPTRVNIYPKKNISAGRPAVDGVDNIDY